MALQKAGNVALSLQLSTTRLQFFCFYIFGWGPKKVVAVDRRKIIWDVITNQAEASVSVSIGALSDITKASLIDLHVLIV